MKPFTTATTSPTGEAIPVYQNAYSGASPSNYERAEMVRKGRATPNGLAFDTFGNCATIYLLPENTASQIEKAIAYAATMDRPRIYTVIPRA